MPVGTAIPAESDEAALADLEDAAGEVRRPQGEVGIPQRLPVEAHATLHDEAAGFVAGCAEGARNELEECGGGVREGSLGDVFGDTSLLEEAVESRLGRSA